MNMHLQPVEPQIVPSLPRRGTCWDSVEVMDTYLAYFCHNMSENHIGSLLIYNPNTLNITVHRYREINRGKSQCRKCVHC